MSVICETCIQHDPFENGRAKCYVFGHITAPYARGCEYWEKCKSFLRTERRADVPLVREFGVLKEWNKRDYSIPTCKIVIETGEVLGKWYSGHSFAITRGDHYGCGSAPSIYGIAMPDERSAIEYELRRLLGAAEHNASEYPEIAEHIKSVLMNNKQLTLFD